MASDLPPNNKPKEPVASMLALRPDYSWAAVQRLRAVSQADSADWKTKFDFIIALSGHLQEKKHQQIGPVAELSVEKTGGNAEDPNRLPLTLFYPTLIPRTRTEIPGPPQRLLLSAPDETARGHDTKDHDRDVRTPVDSGPTRSLIKRASLNSGGHNPTAEGGDSAPPVDQRFVDLFNKFNKMQEELDHQKKQNEQLSAQSSSSFGARRPSEFPQMGNGNNNTFGTIGLTTLVLAVASVFNPALIPALYASTGLSAIAIREGNKVYLAKLEIYRETLKSETLEAKRMDEARRAASHAAPGETPPQPATSATAESASSEGGRRGVRGAWQNHGKMTLTKA